jgi:hypothetical protein
MTRLYLPFEARSCPKDRSTHLNEDTCQLQVKLHSFVLRRMVFPSM